MRKSRWRPAGLWTARRESATLCSRRPVVSHGGLVISSFVSDRPRPVSPPLSSVDDTPMSHRHLKERSSFPSLLRHTDSFAITRLESSSGLAHPITKVSSVPALLVSVSLKSVAIGDYQLWLDDKL